MVARLLKSSACGLLAAALVASLATGTATRAQDKKDKGKEEKVEIPKKVMDALKAKFPKAEVTKVTKEKEDGKVVYDIEFTQAGKKFEADIFEDGTIHNWEREFAAKDLPKAVKDAVAKKWPKASIKEVMEMLDVKDGKDVLHGYEIILAGEDKKEFEVTVAPDGKILEEPKEEKK